MISKYNNNISSMVVRETVMNLKLLILHTVYDVKKFYSPLAETMAYILNIVQYMAHCTSIIKYCSLTIDYFSMFFVYR